MITPLIISCDSTPDRHKFIFIPWVRCDNDERGIRSRWDGLSDGSCRPIDDNGLTTAVELVSWDSLVDLFGEKKSSGCTHLDDWAIEELRRRPSTFVILFISLSGGPLPVITVSRFDTTGVGVLIETFAGTCGKSPSDSSSTWINNTLRYHRLYLWY